MAQDSFFTNKLRTWHQNVNNREMPWKFQKDPYKIWLSEIILQQTRVNQGWDYYLKFVKNFPTVLHLAEAPLDKVLLLWEGLGYYTRARNLHATAKIITQDYKGVFPSNYEDILSLKGIGPYTAAAIASFAFDLPYAVLDGNVIRILSRYKGVDIPYDTSEGKTFFQQLATDFLDELNPGSHNQAIMDFGATICTPANPQCAHCCFSERCVANKLNKQNVLPVKSKRIKVKERNFNYLVAVYKEHTYLHQRSEKDIWLQLYEFPLIETIKQVKNVAELSTHIAQKLNITNFQISKQTVAFRQRLTHQKINANFIQITLNEEPVGYQKIKLKNLSNFAFPRIINLYIEQNITTFK